MDKNKNEDYCICIFPICAGSFPCIIGLVQEFCDSINLLNEDENINLKPQLCLGSSGGNIVSLLGTISNWDSEEIGKIALGLKSEMFLQRWFYGYFSFIPELFYSFFKGSLYNEGYGGLKYFNHIAKNKSITDTEFWIGTYNNTLGKAEFFCNRSILDSQINNHKFNKELNSYISNKTYYCDGNFNIIYQVSIASASIPFIVPPKIINDQFFSDGGVIYASPLSVFSSEIRRIILNKINNEIENTNTNQQIIISSDIENKEKNMRLFYFLYKQNYNVSENYMTFRNIFINTVNSSVIKDRNKGIELLYSLSNNTVESELYFKVEKSELTNILKHYNKYKHYVVCLFPHGTPEIDLTYFNGYDVMKVADQVKTAYGLQIWYSSELK